MKTVRSEISPQKLALEALQTPLFYLPMAAGAIAAIFGAWTLAIPLAAAAIVGFSYNTLLSKKTRESILENEAKRENYLRQAKIHETYLRLPHDLKAKLKTYVDLKLRLDGALAKAAGSEMLPPMLEEQAMKMVESACDTLNHIRVLREAMRASAPVSLSAEIEKTETKLKRTRNEKTREKLRQFLFQAESQLKEASRLIEKENQLTAQLDMGAAELRRALTFVTQLGVGDSDDVLAMQAGALADRIKAAEDVNKELEGYFLQTGMSDRNK